MRNWLSSTLVLVCALGLSGCAAKQFNAVSMSQAGDDALSCDALRQQIAANDAEAEKLWRKDGRVRAGNVAKQVGGAIPIAGLIISANTDFSNEEQVKARSLADRNEHLEYLSKQKGCAP